MLFPLNWKELKERFSKLSGVVILAVFFSLAFSELINGLVMERVSYKTITIKSVDWDTDDMDKGQIVCSAEMIETIKSNNGYEIIPSTNSMSILRPLFEGAEVSFEMQVYPNMYITFEMGTDDGGFQCFKDGVYIRNIGDIEREKHIINYYVFSVPDLIYIYIWYIMFYIIISCLIFVLLNVILKIGNKLKTNYVFDKKEKLIGFIVIASFYFFYVSINYYKNFDLFQVVEGADAYYYMHPTYLDANGAFSLETYINTTYAFRGYIPHIIALIGNGVADFFHMDVMYFYFFFCALLIGGSISFVIPQLYEVTFKKKVSILSPIVFFFIFMLFWSGHSFYFMSDIPAAFLGVDALAFFVRALNGEKDGKHILATGICIGAAAGFRNAYAYIGYIFILICIFKDIFQNKKLMMKNVISNIKRVVIFGIGIIIVLWPQAIINRERGHLGIFPYDGGYLYDIDDAEVISLKEWSFSHGMHRYNLSSDPDIDEQFKMIDGSLYVGKTNYKMNDILYIILSRPKEFFTGFLKKVFWALSVEYEVIYGGLNIPQWQVSLLIIINYLLLYNTLSHMIVGKCFDKKSEKFINMIIILGLLLNVVPQGLLHIERRYFLFFYLLVYLYNSYFLVESGNFKKILSVRYSVSAVIFCAFCYAFRMTIQSNFF